MTTKEALYRLIDELPENTLPAIERYLASVRDDPMIRVLLAAQEEDEPTSPEEDASAREARRRYRRGDFITAEEAKSRLLE